MPSRAVTAAPSQAAVARRGRLAWGIVLLAPAVCLVFALLAVPLVELVEASFRRAEFGQIQPGLTSENYTAVLFSSLYWEIYAKTLGAALLVTFLCAVLGYPVASHLVASPPRRQALLFFLVAAPLLVNTVVRTYGWLLALGRQGIVNSLLKQLGLVDTPLALTGNYLGLLIGSTQVFLPFMILSIVTSLRSIDRHLLESADILGASPARRFLDVELPLAAPGILAGSVLVFSLMLGAFVTPLVLGGTAVRYLSVSVFTDALVLFNLPRATALAMVLLVVTACAYLLQAWLTRSMAGRRA